MWGLFSGKDSMSDREKNRNPKSRNREGKCICSFVSFALIFLLFISRYFSPRTVAGAHSQKC